MSFAWSGSHEFCIPSLEPREGEGFKDIAYPGLHSASHPRLFICQGTSSVSRDSYVLLVACWGHQVI